MRTKTVNQPSKMVTDRVRSCEAVLWALATFDQQLVESLDGQFTPFLGEGVVMPFGTQLALFQERLIHDRDQLVEASRKVRTERAREANLRSARDSDQKVVFDKVVRLRRLVQGAYGDEQLNALGFTRQTSQVPAELLEQADYLSAHLGDPQLRLPASAFGEFALDVAPLSNGLEPAVASLRQSMRDLARQERVSEAAKLEKDRMLESFNRSFLWMARTVESLLRLANLDEVAARVRPSSRRPGVTEVPFEPPQGDGETPESGEAPDGDGASGEADGEPSSEEKPEAEPAAESS